MSKAPAIVVQGLGKTYRVWHSPANRLKAALATRATRWTQQVPTIAKACTRYHDCLFDEFTALDDIAFELKQGDALGIIGPNGSGKSTLLQIIAGLLAPTQGSVRVMGRVSALLELGSGFNPEFTGRENVYLNGAILGIPRARLDALLPTITSFADIGEFIDRPIKLYSTGMVMRLAFAVQVHVEPDVLIVDEALAVGDAAFQAKAMAKIEQILERGTTLLFVGHDLNAVRTLCDQALYLRSGHIQARGDPEEVTRQYMFDVQRTRVQGLLGADTRVDAVDRDCGVRGVRFIDARFAGTGAGRHATVAFGETLDMYFRIALETTVAHPRLFLDLLDLKGIQITGRLVDIPTYQDGETLTCRLRLAARLQQGVYRLRVRVANAPNPAQAVTLRRHDALLSFEIVDDSRERFLGLFELPMQIDWQETVVQVEVGAR